MQQPTNQSLLSDEQVSAFYHDEFVTDQVDDFLALIGPSHDGVVVDIGGGCGFFAKHLAMSADTSTRVIDMDRKSVESCHALGVEARQGDALGPDIEGDETVVCFNLILHHLVGQNEADTRAMQLKALRVWRGRNVRLFVNEYIYQSFVGGVSSRLIYEITSSAFLSAIGKFMARFVPAFRANTFNVGVRFRSHENWRQMFSDAGFKVVGVRIGRDERVSPALRSLLIKTIRRDSFMLEPT